MIASKNVTSTCIIQTNQKRFSIFVQRATFKICEKYLFGKGRLDGINVPNGESFIKYPTYFAIFCNFKAKDVNGKDFRQSNKAKGW